MHHLAPSETLVTGEWIVVGGQIAADEACKRIDELIAEHLVELGHATWATLYLDPNDGRLWERVFPKGHMHGAGPPQLQWITQEEAERKYGEEIARKK